MSHFIYLLCPADLEKFTGEDDAFKELGSYVYSEDDSLAESVKAAFEKLPDREYDMMDMYYNKGMHQEDIGKYFNVSQGDVSYHIKRGLRRIKFYLEFPEIDVEKMKADLALILPKDTPRSNKRNANKNRSNDLYLKIMVGMYTTSCQTLVAKELGIHQGGVRYRFIKAVEIITAYCEENPEYEVYKKAFTMLMGNHNILRELKTQERWKHKFIDTLL